MRSGNPRRRRRTLSATNTCPHLEALQSRRLLSAGDLDPTFSGDGKATIDIPGSLQDTALTLARQTDGRIVVGSISDRHISLLRYLPDGSVDPTFGDGGTARLLFGQPIEIPRDLAIDPEGRILVAGSMAIAPGLVAGDFAVARLTPDGELDPTFDGDGLARVDFNGNYDGAYGIALRPDGGIVVAGLTRSATSATAAARFAVAALRPDGSPDTAFGGGDGQVVTVVGNAGAFAAGVALDGAGRIVTAGNTGATAGAFAVVRYLPDGTLDPAFDGDGVATTPFSDGIVNAVALGPGGKIVVAGASTFAGRGHDLTAVRYNDDGSLDQSFDGDGKVAIDMGQGATYQHDRATSVAVNPDDGSIILGGFTTPNPVFGGPLDGRAAVVRLLPGGAPDPAFDGDGRQVGPANQLLDVVLAPDGAVIGAGEAPDAGPFGTTDVLLLKYTATGAPAPGFGGGAGVVTTDVQGPVFNRPRALLVQPDGKVILGGETESGHDRVTDIGLARFNEDGTPDLSFGSAGIVASDFSRHQDWLHALALQPDGKILAGGYNTGADGNEDVLVVRYLPDGTLDPSFGAGGKFTLADVGGLPVFGTAIALQPDGRILLGGGLGGAVDTDTFLVVRLNPAGTLDTTFGGGDGVVVTPVSGAGTYLMGWGIRADGLGRIVVVGGQNAVAVARYDAAGNLDPSFDGDGIAVTQFSSASGAVGVPTSLAVDGSNRVVVAGHTHEPSKKLDFGLLRLREDGSLDPAFGNGGRVVTDFAGFDDYAAGVVVLPDDSVVAAGTSLAAAASPTRQPADFALARYTPAGVLDPTFGGGDGKVTTDVSGLADVGYAVALAPGGRLVVGGEADGDFGAARYLLESPAPPTVRSVAVGGSGWFPEFRQYLRGAGLADAAGSFVVPTDAAQVLPLPWTSLDQVDVTFDQDVKVKAADLRVRGINVPEYALDSAAFTYDRATRTATWKLAGGAVFGSDRILLDLDATPEGVRGNDGRLDGDADGTAGGDFRFRLNVLPGDVNRSGAVLADDFSEVKRKFFSSTRNPRFGDSAYSVFHDVSGSGAVLANDYSEVKSRFFTTLPAGEPVAPAGVPAVAAVPNLRRAGRVADLVL